MSNRRGPPDRPSLSGRFLDRLEVKRPGEESALTAAPPAPEPSVQIPRYSAVLPTETAPKELRPVHVYLETVVITALFPLVGLFVDRTDPFFFTHSFSWLAVAPLLVGARHGFALGLATAMMTDVGITLFWRSTLQPHHVAFPGELVIGIVVVAMITGQFSDVFRRDTARLRRGLQTARRRLDALSRAQFLLELSHDRIVQQQPAGAPNLRDAIASSRKLVADRGSKALGDVAPSMLEIFGAYFSVEVCSLFAVQSGRVVGESLGALGKPRRVDPNDAQIADAIATGALTFFPAAMARGARTSSTALLAVVPFIDTSGNVHAVLAIESMPFVAFERRNLEAMVVLGGHIADAFEGARDEHGTRLDLQLIMERALSDLRSFKVPATLVLLRVAATGKANDVLELVLGGALRELDFPYATRDPGGDLSVFVLLPMSDEAVALSLLERISKMVQRETGTTLETAGASFTYHALDTLDTVDSAMAAVERRRDHAQDAPLGVAQ